MDEHNPGRFEKTRKRWEERQRPRFLRVCNEIFRRENKPYKMEEFNGPDEPDFVLKKIEKGKESIVAYFEAEFPREERWPPGEEFEYPTIRWPQRKFKHYNKEKGLYRGKPLFMITVRSDCKDAFYVDAKTWLEKARKEYIGGEVFYGLPKDHPDMGRGIGELVEYVERRIHSVYEM